MSFGESSVQPLDYPLVLLFDGECSLCVAAVRFVLRWDLRAEFRFASLASPISQALLARSGVGPAPDSLVLIESGRALVGSDAVAGVLRHLGGIWHLWRLAGLLPKKWRDGLYFAVARRRAEWSARMGLSCALPTDALRSRFLG